MSKTIYQSIIRHSVLSTIYAYYLKNLTFFRCQFYFFKIETFHKYLISKKLTFEKGFCEVHLIFYFFFAFSFAIQKMLLISSQRKREWEWVCESERESEKVCESEREIVTPVSRNWDWDWDAPFFTDGVSLSGESNHRQRFLPFPIYICYDSQHCKEILGTHIHWCSQFILSMLVESWSGG